MIRRLPLLLLLAALPARAEDFTGFYAGVNAGYASGRETNTGTAPLVTSGAPSGGNPSATALPPSASAAAAGVQRTGRGANSR